MRRKVSAFCSSVLVLAALGASAFSQDGCPIQITKVEYLKGASPFAAYVTHSNENYRVTYQNTSAKEIEAMSFTIQYFDVVDAPTFTVPAGVKDKVRPGQTKRVIGAAWLGNRGTRIAAYIDRVKFRDGTYWNDGGLKLCQKASDPAK